jgi:hypothetical protein
MVACYRATCRPGPLATKVTFGYYHTSCTCRGLRSKLDKTLDGGGARCRAACRPGSLATQVTLGYKHDRSLVGGAPPGSLQTWTVSRNSNQSLRAWMVAHCHATCRPGPLTTKVASGYGQHSLGGGEPPCSL